MLRLRKDRDNFIEVSSVEEANEIDLGLFTFVRFSESREKYIFKRRER